MNRDNLLKLSIEIVKSPNLQINLSRHSLIKETIDFDEVEGFFSKYSAKYNLKLFHFSSNTFLIKKEHSVLHKIFNSLVSLQPTDFEKTAAILCDTLNYSNYYATKVSKDEGIDFIADRKDNDYLNTEEILFGQCKHFDKKLVTVGEIRELAGATTLFKKGEFMSDKSYISIVKKIKSHSSLKTLFVTSYFFSKEAIEVCHKSGIVPIDIIDLIHLLFKGLKENKYKWTDKNFSYFYQKKFNADLNKTKTLR